MPLVFVYLSLELCDSTADVAKVPRLIDWDRAWIGRVILQAFKKGRWERAGVVNRSTSENWPILPCGRTFFSEGILADNPELAAVDLCTIETTQDEPSETVLDNSPASRCLAEIFPTVTTLCRPSSLEAALVKWARNRSPNFTELSLGITAIDRARIRRWTEWAAEARKRSAGNTEPAFPAGPATDRAVKPGTWLSFPLLCGGFGVALVVRREAGVVIFGDAMVYGFPRVFEKYPTLAEVQDLTADDACFLGGTSLVTVRDGRWRVLGLHAGFRENEWVVPYRWHQTPSQAQRGEIGIGTRSTDPQIVSFPNHLLSLDPHSGDVANINYGAGTFEFALAVCARHRDKLDLVPHYQSALVTSERVAAWRRINAAIDRALGKG